VSAWLTRRAFEALALLALALFTLHGVLRRAGNAVAA
jgi:hypothetical protein